ncbi:MAG: S41 family peptidase [Bacteroidales bacterium]|jgi:hypothetical protein|nr:S41 family peptidase [Bacteroidales bacterium]
MKQLIIISIFLIFFTQCNAQSVVKNETLEGKWFLEWESNDIGTVRTFMEFHTNNGKFEANSRKKAGRDILGSWNSTLVRIFTKSLRYGSFLNITEGIYETEIDTLKFAGYFKSLIGTYIIRGYIYNDTLNAKLTNGREEIKGTITGIRKNTETPLENYSSLFETSIKITENNIYNKDVLQTKKWRSFEKDMQNVSKKVQDDLEMVAAFFFHARKLPFSHYGMMKLQEYKEDKNNQKEIKHVFLEEKSDQTVYMKINSFSGPKAEMDSIFSIIIQKNYKNLIVDLRNNSGGSIEAAIPFAQNLVDTTIYGGIFLTQKWFNKHKTPPALNEYKDFPHFSEANFDLIIEGIHNTEGLCLKIVPYGNIYKGNVFILTNKKTASTCEPIVYGLKQHKRAIIVGEKTAGSMLNGELIYVANGFSLIIPTADYYTSDGYKIDHNGVIPDIEIKQEKALDYVMGKLIKD